MPYSPVIEDQGFQSHVFRSAQLLHRMVDYGWGMVKISCNTYKKRVASSNCIVRGKD